MIEQVIHYYNPETERRETRVICEKPLAAALNWSYIHRAVIGLANSPGSLVHLSHVDKVAMVRVGDSHTHLFFLNREQQNLLEGKDIS